MKILALNKYFYLRGGTERYMFDVADLLSHHGHEVIPFAMDDTKNDPTPWSKFFVSHTETEAVKFTISGAKTAANILYSFPAKKRLTSLLKATRPTVAHIHNIYHQLSSSVLDALQNAQIPAVMTIHDYRLLSPNYTLFHDGQMCERGLKNSLAVIPHRCVKHSYAASTLAALETALVRARKSYEKTISRFIVPSRAVYALFERAGWDMKKFVVIPHFLDTRNYIPKWEAHVDETPAHNSNAQKSVVYAGRLSPEKGIGIFIEAARRLPHVTFNIVGAGPEEAHLRAQAQHFKNVHFKGWKTGDALHEEIRSASLAVVPSLWPEVFGYAALESMALGTPVIASRIGALPEIIQDKTTGALFTPGNPDELAGVIQNLLSQPEALAKMSHAARARVEVEYNPEKHFGRLMEAYSDALIKHL